MTVDPLRAVKDRLSQFVQRVEAHTDHHQVTVLRAAHRADIYRE